MILKKSIWAIAALVLLVVGCNSKPNLKYPEISGHRGAENIAPENTMASLDSCIKYNIEFAECDIIISKDSVFYILHDHTLDRTTNGTGPIAEWNSADIDTLDAGSWFGEKFKGQRVPKLTDFLKKAKESGLKLTLDYRTGDITKMVDLVREAGMIENCTYVFYNTDDYFELKNNNPDVNMLQAYIDGASDYDKIYAEMKPNIAVIYLDSLTLELSRHIKKDGVKVLALAFNKDATPEELYQRAAELEVDVIATGNPEAMKKMNK